MAIKNKHWILITLSSTIVAVVILCTLFGYGIYMQWKDDLYAVRYRDSIYRITADIFKNQIEISGLRTICEENGTLLKVPYVEGRIRNNSPKTLVSVMIGLSFSRPSGVVLYRGWFSPMGEEKLPDSPFFSTMKRAKKNLPPGESITFRYLLKNCPQEVVEDIARNKSFAKESGGDKDITLELSITGLSVS
jgi:hypothetical protein